MNSIYNCPHCGKKSFNPIKKAFAGQLNSKGKICMKCGRRVVNGKGATIFNAIFSGLAFVCIVLVYIFAPNTKDTSLEWIWQNEVLINICLLLSIYTVPKIVNAFFFRLAPAIRIEPVK